MYNYIIIPTYPGYRLVVYSQVIKHHFDVNKFHEAVSILQTLNMRVRPDDKKYSSDAGMNFIPNSVNTLDTDQELDTETTVSLNVNVSDVA